MAIPPKAPVKKTSVPVSQPREETGTPPGSLADGDIGGNTVARLIFFRPFMNYFCWLAHKQHPAHHRAETRVQTLRTQNPKFYWMCVACDFVLILVGVIILICAAGAALYKTVWL